MFFSFEGIDGSGKSTQARLLASALRRRGLEVVEVREPGGTDLGEQVRSLLLAPHTDVAPRAELLLFSAARAQLVDEVIRPALTRGAVVVADRFFDSSTAYQGGGRGLANDRWFDALHSFATDGLAPARTYFVDVDVATADERRSAREADRIESSGSAFYESVREAYAGIASRSPERVLVVDGRLSPQNLHDLVLDDSLRYLDV